MLGLRGRRGDEQDHPGRISDPQEVIARAKALSVELGTPITPGFEALVFKASRGIEDIYELTYIRKDGSRFPAVVSVTALRDAPGRHHRLSAHRHRQHRAQAGRGRAEEARPAPARPAVLHALAHRIEHRRADDHRSARASSPTSTSRWRRSPDCTRDELIGAPFKNYFTDPDRAEAAIKLVLSEKKVTDYELTARARDGKDNRRLLQRDHLLRSRPHAAGRLRGGPRRHGAQALRAGAPGDERRARERQGRWRKRPTSRSRISSRA